MNEDKELKHFGVKGQKWFLRRWQNKDGSLTPEGRVHYGYGKEESSSGSATATPTSAKSTSSTTVAKLKTLADAEEADNEAREALKQSVIKSRSAKTVLENADLFTDKELQDVWSRLNTERNIKNLAQKDESENVSRFSAFVDKSVKTGKTINEVADTGIKLWNNVVAIHNTVNSDNPWPRVNMGDQKKKKEENK